MDYREKIKFKYNEFLSKNMLKKADDLKEYYEAFYERFNAEKLKSMDGELLLNTMFNHGNKESLVYYLEFKTYKDIPNIFGKIAGGSSFKFGVYKRKEDGKWIIGTTKNPKEATIEEAIEVAREKRDLMVKGVEIINSLPNKYDYNTYKNLEEHLITDTKGLSDTAWVHKYYHMLFPEKIDTFHTLEYQRFFMIKLLEKPKETKGRYELSSFYIKLSKELNIPVANLNYIIGELYGPYHKYWRINTVNENGESLLNEMMENECISIGWTKLGDLSKINSLGDKKAKDNLKLLINEKYMNASKSTNKIANEIYNFIKYITSEDIVVAVEGNLILAIGKVIGNYEFNAGLEFPNTIKVNWLKYFNGESLPEPKEGLKTIVNAYGKNTDNLLKIEKLLQREDTHIGLSSAIKKLKKLEGTMEQIENILQRKKQVILYGPSGTGKTYFAEKTAFELAARKAFNKNYEDLNDEELAIVQGNNLSAGLVRMCCFHPSYGYEDFIEGIKPTISENNMQTLFKLRDGIFKSLCKEAKVNADKNYYLIIDEINRGDISRIFGELITLLESNKREKNLILPLSNTLFNVPKNVFIIGTMNTSDRSITLLDTALRRRFGFIEIMPDYSLLANSIIEGLPLELWLKELNKRLCQVLGKEGRNLQIGHSYFMENNNAIQTFESLNKVILEDIIPLLEEYFYGDYESISKIIGNSLINIENGDINFDIFKPSKKDELINALLSPCAEIKTSFSVCQEDCENEDIKGEL
ncbi:AAA family ATPase [Clostridium tarantellae]|uniref:AAA domain-containing protein n=1 Tax=Clostridium tarantellae TaxID=39493 RepID=A0A6I1MP20_9CLOT|nr:AAA family ATPase [Clostridium tarantellae]MPQ44804.1 AAA domain-containing protein [Clostridium tarantellae]